MKRGDGGAIRLDRLDLKILAALQASGRMTNLDLAQAVGLSATPCLQRVKRMEAAGYIRGYGAELDIDRLASSITVFTQVMLRNHRREDFLRFERGIQDIPHILNCFLVTGGYDYLAQFIARDILDYQLAVESLLDRDLGVEKYFSYVAIKQVKRSGGYPLALLMPEAQD
ncbi:AsnC family transcriptional regulator [Aliidongia dinghuensis]|uniref:AsnC family transcriptional regulator n=1 Tax=Aliidongia dinghuensis TaxID=1867774 RepID=A0A8J3E0W9_9PROT|nr:Lrp/AsnC family transcriptional regulator [Aliidongia dinghuensis]GGF05582.1 AsnC family transcriptional regulator [Aliidongia dinghuensis]